MSCADINKVTAIVTMLRSYGCPLSHRIKGDKVQFIGTGNVRMSKWLSAKDAKTWADGYLIGAGHRKET